MRHTLFYAWTDEKEAGEVEKKKTKKGNIGRRKKRMKWRRGRRSRRCIWLIRNER
jgi:hypothetical protein